MSADAQVSIDLQDLEALGFDWEPCYTFRVRYLQEGTEWTAVPADGGTPLTASSAQELRKLLRQAAPVDRDPQ